MNLKILMNLNFNLLLCLMISLLVLMIALMMSKKSFMDREKNSPFECGFDPKGSSRIPFSMRFFLIAVIFLIFDIEIVLILPIPISLLISYTNVYIISVIFLFLLVIGLFYEWNEGALEWAKYSYI
uniref:NADH-ubiquinone oxidoreductase chain 3 n=1 Tax=Metaperipatus inae TaxID=444703 RepID=B3F5K8_9BILA|nr:NADH dehydrogenase subunit 3 [Metaperipatus inae]ABQ95566.1 NADH dehydrogenase subunit 3 [Metaperipatus inae]